LEGRAGEWPMGRDRRGQRLCERGGQRSVTRDVCIAPTRTEEKGERGKSHEVPHTTQPTYPHTTQPTHPHTTQPTHTHNPAHTPTHNAAYTQRSRRCLHPIKQPRAWVEKKIHRCECTHAQIERDMHRERETCTERERDMLHRKEDCVRRR